MGDIEITARDAGKKFTLPTGKQHRFKVRRYHVRFLEVEDALFAFGSVVMQPDNASSDGTPDQNRISGIEVLRAIYLHAADNPKQKLLLAGHADSVGYIKTNDELSQLRAQNVLHLLLGEKDPWVKMCNKHDNVSDVKLILRWCAKTLGFPCDPGTVDRYKYPEYDEAVKQFQQSFSDWAEGYAIKVDSKVGPEVWGAFYHVYMIRLRELVGTDDAGLDELRGKLVFLYDDAKYVGCGEYHPVDMPGRDNYESAKNRRVEALFYDAGEEPLEKPAGNMCHAGGTPKVKQCLLYNPALYSYEYIKPKSLRVVHCDAQFAPAKESLDISYRILGLADKPVKLDIVSTLKPDEVLFSRDLTDDEKTDGVHAMTWDGKATAGELKDKAVHPLVSPFRIDIHDGEAHHAIGTFKVLYHSIELKQGPWTPDEAEPPASDEKAWVAYKLNMLGYYGGPVGMDTESYLERAIIRYKANHKAMHQLDYANYNGAITDTLKKALAAGDSPRTWLEGDPFADDTIEARVLVEALTYETDKEFSGNKSSLEQARLNRPLIPVEATISLKGKDGGKVLAPEGVGPVRVTWCVIDAPENLDDQPTDAPDSPSHTKEFLETCLALEGGDPADDDNCAIAFGGIRDGAVGSAHKAGLAGDFYVPYTVEEDDKVAVLFTKACVDGVKFPKRLGKAGFLFRPSHIAGDDYRIEAVIDFEGLPNEAELRAAHGLAEDVNIFARTGVFRIWRTGKVVLSLTWPPRTNSSEWALIVDEFRKAWHEVDTSHIVTKKLIDVLPEADYVRIVADNTKHKEKDIRLLEDAYVGVKLPKQGLMSAAKYRAAIRTFTYDNYWDKTVYLFRKRLSEILRKEHPTGWIALDFMTHRPVVVLKNPPFDRTVKNPAYITASSSIGLADATVFVDQKDRDKVYYVVAHEIGHTLWLHHYEHAGGTKPLEHDPNDHNCIMSYSSESCEHPHHRPGKYTPHFCGLCNARLRGWSIAMPSA